MPILYSNIYGDGSNGAGGGGAGTPLPSHFGGWVFQANLNYFGQPYDPVSLKLMPETTAYSVGDSSGVSLVSGSLSVATAGRYWIWTKVIIDLYQQYFVGPFIRNKVLGTNFAEVPMTISGNTLFAEFGGFYDLMMNNALVDTYLEGVVNDYGTQGTITVWQRIHSTF